VLYYSIPINSILEGKPELKSQQWTATGNGQREVENTAEKTDQMGAKASHTSPKYELYKVSLPQVDDIG
jgi:hypothetical protein